MKKTVLTRTISRFMSLSHWPQFEFLARNVLLACQYKIVVPDEDSVYEHFFGNDGKICPKTLLTNTISPKVGPKLSIHNDMWPAEVFVNLCCLFVYHSVWKAYIPPKHYGGCKPASVADRRAWFWKNNFVQDYAEV